MKIKTSFIFALAFFTISLFFPFIAIADDTVKDNDPNTFIASVERGADPLGRKSVSEISLDKAEKEKKKEAYKKREKRKISHLQKLEDQFGNLSPAEKRLVNELPYEVRVQLKNIPKENRLDWLIDRVVERKKVMVRDVLMKDKRFENIWEKTPPEDRDLLLKKSLKMALATKYGKGARKPVKGIRQQGMIDSPVRDIQGVVKEFLRHNPEVKEKLQNLPPEKRKAVIQEAIKKKMKEQGLGQRPQVMKRKMRMHGPGAMDQKGMKPRIMMKRKGMQHEGMKQKGMMKKKGMPHEGMKPKMMMKKKGMCPECAKQKGMSGKKMGRKQMMPHREMMMQKKGEHKGKMKMMPEMRKRMMQKKFEGDGKKRLGRRSERPMIRERMRMKIREHEKPFRNQQGTPERIMRERMKHNEGKKMIPHEGTMIIPPPPFEPPKEMAPPQFMNPEMHEKMIQFFMQNPDHLRMMLKRLPPEFKMMLRKMLDEEKGFKKEIREERFIIKKPKPKFEKEKQPKEKKLKKKKSD